MPRHLAAAITRAVVRAVAQGGFREPAVLLHDLRTTGVVRGAGGRRAG